MAKILILVMWTSLALGWVYLGAAHSQPQPETQLTLARAAVGECGWLLPDCEAGLWPTMARRTVDALKNRAGVTLRSMTLAYCSIFRGKHEGRRVWVRSLSPSGEKPYGWPKQASWARYRDRWQRIYQRAGDFLAGKVKDSCKGSPTHTGGLMDKWRMSPEIWREVDCGITRSRTRAQFFWERR